MEFARLKIADLKLAHYNPRKITDEALRRLEMSVREHGLVEPIVVNKQTGNRVVGGHQRIKVLQKLGYEEVDCVVIDYPEAREKALNVALNNPSMAGEFDFGPLANLLSEIDTGEFSVTALTGYDENQLRNIASFIPVPANGKEGSNNPNDHWSDMPEFQNKERAFKSIAVHFESESAFMEFQKILNIPISVKTLSIWFPPKQARDLSGVFFSSKNEGEDES